MGKTYEQRKADGRTCHTVWLSREATSVIAQLMEALGVSKTEALELLIKKADLSALTRQPQMRPSWQRNHHITLAKPKRAPEARSIPEPGSPADLARKVLAKDARRGATVVATGRRVMEGRERR